MMGRSVESTAHRNEMNEMNSTRLQASEPRGRARELLPESRLSRALRGSIALLTKNKGLLVI